MNPTALASGVAAWWARGRHRIVALAAVATAFGVLLGLALGHWRSSPGPYMRPLVMHGRWLKAPGAPGYAGYFRRRIDLPGPVKHAWIAVTAREGFEVCINRNPAGRFYLWRPTRPFQTGLSEGGQVIHPSPPALALNFPREYQWSSHRNDWLPAFFDVTPNFVPGRNVITIEVESRRAPAAFRLAIETGVPILPVAVHGCRTALRSKDWRLGYSTAEVRVLDPIDVTGLTMKDIYSLRDKTRDVIAAEIDVLRAELGN